MSSPAHKRRASEAQGNAIVAVSAAADVNSNPPSTQSSSPYNMSVGQSASTPHAFNIDTFDFGADFSLPSSLDELSIFQNNGNGGGGAGTTNASAASNSSEMHQAASSTSSRMSQAGGSGSQASPAASASMHVSTSTSRNKGGAAGSVKHAGSNSGAPTSSNNSVAGSPRSLHFSPRTTMREQVLHANRSRNQSPHNLSSMSSSENVNARSAGGTTSSANVNAGVEGVGMGAGGASGAGGGSSSSNNGANGMPNGLHLDTSNNNLPISATELQNLLQAINASTVSQQQHQQQIQGGNLSIGELEKLLSEKEQMERMQSIQTAYLRQQIEALQRQVPGAPVGLPFQHTGNDVHAGSSTASMSAAQLMQQFQQMNSQQQTMNNSFSGPPPFPMPFSMPGSESMHQQQHSMATFGNASSSKPGMSSNMNQFGLITPVSSDAFASASKHQHPFVSPLNMPGSSQHGHQASTEHPGLITGSFTPLESPAITPASVFSNVGSSSTSTDIFSPLTSPALHPQQHGHDGMSIPISPFHGPIKGRPKGRGMHGASPNAPPPTKSVPRKNRSTTAEARANRARASPLVKPTLPSAVMSQQARKRNESHNGSLPSPLGPNIPTMSGSTDNTGSRRTSQEFGDGKQTPTAFPPLSVGSGSAKPMDASPSEAAASTPSPIEMPPPNGKPMTPGSLMGIRGGSDESSNSSGKATQNGKAEKKHNLSTSSTKSNKTANNDKQVTFAPPQSPGGQGLPILLPQERDNWMLGMKTSGGGAMGAGAAGGNGNVGGLESRRTSHKAAEQKRRDSLKYCFDELRGMLPAIALDDDVPGGSMLGPDGLLEDQDAEGFLIEEVGDGESARIANRAISKVALLRHSNEYLIRLKHRIGRRERDLATCRREIMELRSRLGMPVPPEWPALTASMAGSAAVMGHNMSAFFNVESMAEQMHPHQAAILAAALQQQQQQQQQQASNHRSFDMDSMAAYAQQVQSSSMDTSS